MNQKDRNYYEKLSNGALNDVFMDACEKGDLDTIKYLYTFRLNYQPDLHSFDGLAFIYVCSNPNIKMLEYILTSPEVKVKPYLHLAVENICNNGNLPAMKYFFNNELFKKENISRNSLVIEDNYTIGLAAASYGGHLEAVKYLMSFEDLKKDTKIFEKIQRAIESACFEGHIAVIDFLLNLDYPKLAEIPPHAIINACKHNQVELIKYFLKSNTRVSHTSLQTGLKFAYTSKCENVINYLIFEYKMKKDKSLTKIINDIPELKSYFNFRDLQEKTKKIPIQSSANPGKI